LSELKGPTRQSTTSVVDTVYDAEFETLYRATKALVNSVQQMYHPLIAEYLSTKHAWDTLQFQLQFLELPPATANWAPFRERRDRIKGVQDMKRTAAMQLLSIKKACLAEDLNEILEMVMDATGVSEDDLIEWENLASEGNKGHVLRLELLNHQEPKEQRKDRQTRTLEWMLGVFYASSYLVELQKGMIAYKLQENSKMVARSNIFTSWADDLQEQVVFDRAVSSRMMLKFWFLDTTTAMEEDYALSHWDSEATMRRIDADFAPDMVEYSGNNMDDVDLKR